MQMRLKLNFSKNGVYNEKTSLFMGATLAATKNDISTLYRPFFEKSAHHVSPFFHLSVYLSIRLLVPLSVRPMLGSGPKEDIPVSLFVTNVQRTVIQDLSMPNWACCF